MDGIETLSAPQGCPREGGNPSDKELAGIAKAGFDAENVLIPGLRLAKGYNFIYCTRE